MKFRENVSLAQFSNYKIGGAARFFFEPKDEREVAWAVREAHAAKQPIFILGGGTNLLLSDSGFDGLVVRPAIEGIKSVAAKKSAPKGSSRVEVGAGVSMKELLVYTTGKSLLGLEWAGGLPGTLGGAIRGNAGCFGGEIKDIVVTVKSFDMKKMKVVERAAKECKFGYRDSVFKHDEKKASGHSGARALTGAADEIILSAALALVKGDKKMIARAISEKIAHRAKNHPLEYPSIGSIFKNVPVIENHFSEEKPARLGHIHLAKKQYQAALAAQSLEFRGSAFSVKTDPFPVISAAKLISEAGLRGVSFGGAMISGKHPNFIVNVLDASASDVQNLITLAKAEVKKKFGVALEEEVQIV